MWLTECIAGCLWAAHVIADPDYTATPGLTKAESSQAGDALFRCSGYVSTFDEVTYASSNHH